MHVVSIFGLVALGVLPTDWEAQPPGAQPLPEPIATRQALFSIPFQVDQRAQPGQEPVEVQLYVSVDRGATWHHYSKVEPQQGHFLFRAGGDGEFWFLIRTLDSSGQLHPSADGPPGLRVVVDSTPPKLELKTERGAAGQVTVRWQAEEANLDLDTLRIQYRTDTNRVWQFVAVDRRGVESDGARHQGEVTWWLGPEVARVEVRAEVADTADNPAVTHAQVDSEPPPDPVATVAAAPRQQPIDFPVTDPAPPSDWRASADRAPDASWQPRSEPSLPSGLPDAEPAAIARSAALNQLNQQNSDEMVALPKPAQGSVAIQIHPPIRNRFVVSDPSRSAPGAAGVSPRESVRMVSSRVFELEYDVESVGPSGIDRVQLWGTRDGGRTWSSFGIDDDDRSPLLVTVREEGVYGFRVAVTNGAGLGGDKPKTGAKPDFWIGVDQTKPTARILTPEQNGRGQAGQLVIRWTAEDEMLADRPVSLYYSGTVGGPWTLIAGELENSGKYTWSLDGREPKRLYLRVQVRDQAGNLGVAETHSAISLDERQPVVRIREVRPLSHSAQTPPRRSYVK